VPKNQNETRNAKGDILRSVLSNAALKQQLHLTPAMTLEQGIAKTYTWYKENQ
jgi:UDP-glucose 4-epimerase